MEIKGFGYFQCEALAVYPPSENDSGLSYLCQHATEMIKPLK